MLNIICRFKDTFLLLLLVCNKSVTNLGIPYAVYSIFPHAVYSVPLDSLKIFKYVLKSHWSRSSWTQANA